MAKTPANKTKTVSEEYPHMESTSNPYSFSSFQSFFNENFSLIIIVILFFLGGFFFGSVWTEKNIYKAGGTATGAANTGTTGTGTAAAPAGRDLSIPGLVAKAEALGVNADELELCINSDETASIVTDQQASGTAAGVSGTPGTFIVLDGVVVDNIPGALPYAQVQPMIDQYLATTTPVANPDFSSVPAVTEEDHFRGNKAARLVLVEYSDFECPFCEQFHSTMTQLMSEYGDDIGWVYRNYPLAFHPSAQKAAEAAECVAKLNGNDTYWQYADSLFSN